MNVIGLKEFLKEDKEKIIDLLNATGFEKITYNSNKNEIRCSRDTGRNPTSVRLNLDTLLYKCYSTNDSGDIISLIQKKKYFTFKQTIDYIKKYFNLDNVELQEKKYPFSGFYKRLLHNNIYSEDNLKTYPETILDKYLQTPNLRFLKDNINLQVQQEFKIGFDLLSLRVTIPWRCPDGNLCGIIGRLNQDNVDDDIPKYLPIIPFPKSLTLYGFSEDYINLVEKTIWIAEAEKSKLQAKSIGINNVLSIGCNSISATQIKLIKSLYPEKIILGFDEGIEEEYIREECKKFLNTSYFKYKVGYFDNKILPKGSKMSPFDLGENIKYAVRRNIKWVNEN